MVVIVSVASEVGRTGASTSPEAVVACEDVEMLMRDVEVVDKEVVVVVRVTAGPNGVVVEGPDILEELLNVLVSVGEAVTVGVMITVLVEASTPGEY